jgi:peptide/nickel transport system permease protein
VSEEGGAVSRSLQVGLVIIGFLVAVALLAPFFIKYNPAGINLGQTLNPPSLSHLMGTDELGRDVLDRVIFGARTSLWIGAVSIFVGIVVGVSLGLATGYIGGKIDFLVTRVIDLILSFPYLLLAILVVVILGSGVNSIIIAIGLREGALLTRIMRGEVIATKSRQYVVAARAVGSSGVRIATRHILPNSIPTVLVLGTLDFGSAILTSAALGFIGLGVQPPTPEWGAMMGESSQYFLSAPYLLLFPGLAILITVLGFNLIGDGLRDLMDPRYRLQAAVRPS